MCSEGVWLRCVDIGGWSGHVREQPVMTSHRGITPPMTQECSTGFPSSSRSPSGVLFQKHSCGTFSRRQSTTTAITTVLTINHLRTLSLFNLPCLRFCAVLLLEPVTLVISHKPTGHRLQLSTQWWFIAPAYLRRCVCALFTGILKRSAHRLSSCGSSACCQANLGFLYI